MNVKLISWSQGAPKRDLPEDIQELVAYCARVSNPSNQMNTETNDRLLAYLLKHKHFSPFEMVSLCLEIDTTRDIARQILRHRSFSFQEFSQRYADPESMGYPFELREARLQDDKNRQNSVVTDDEELQREWYQKQKKVIAAAAEAYGWAVAHGIAKEQARCVLPEGNTKSRMYMNGTLRSWLHYIELRAENGTQAEHMAIARECAKVISEVYPVEVAND
jgi:thymidylate synthase (FAD)